MIDRLIVFITAMVGLVTEIVSWARICRASPTLASNPLYLSLFIQTDIGGPKTASNVAFKPVFSLRTVYFFPNRFQIWGAFGVKEDPGNVLSHHLARLAVTPLSFYPFFLSTPCATDAAALQPWTPPLPPPRR
jgi:hypothetical protein